MKKLIGAVLGFLCLNGGLIAAGERSLSVCLICSAGLIIAAIILNTGENNNG